MDVAEWLRTLGMERYAAVFRENDIGADLLRSLTAENLKELGVASVGHRVRLLEAIAALRPAPAAAASAKPDAEPRTEPEAERRQVTVMFCDLVGSTALASRLDPEDLREVIGNFQRRVAQTVARSDGFVAKYMGDGVLTYFGYPHAHEDDAEQAVRAGLALIDAVGELQAPQRLQVRIGIATGLVVVGDLIGAGSAQEQAIVGETPNLAARLQALADPGAIVISESTRRQIGARFEIHDLGPQSLKGFAELQRAWRVLAENRALGRFEALRSQATPLIGRREEMELLLGRWAQAKSGSGQVVLISAEPGIGKSRLAEALAKRIASEPHVRLRYFCSPHQQHSPLHPLIAQLERASAFARDDAPEAKLAKLEALLAQSNATDEAVALIASLLSIPTGERYRLPETTPQKHKEKTLAAVFAQLTGLAARQPVLVIYEDVHWLDPSTHELLDRTMEQIANWPVLLVSTFRPEFQPPWTGQPHVTMLALTRLDRHDTAAMVANIAGNAALPTEIVRDIAERTDGVPLFVEELTKAVLEAGTQRATPLLSIPHSALSVPATLHASLMARLDRLGPAAKDVAQTGAVIGREFGHELLLLIADRVESELREALDRLTTSGLLFARGTPPQSSYVFKHALVQDTACGTLLRGRRQELHRRIAEALDTRFPEIAQSQPELLAHHFTEAGLADKALEYWPRAGLRAFRASANVEAIAHVTKGLELLGTLAHTPERARQELRLQILLGQASVARHGFGARETIAAYSRARFIAEELEELSPRLVALSGLWTAQYARAAPEQREAAREFLILAERHPTRGRLCVAHRYIGGSFLVCGELLAARDHLERAITFYDPNEQKFSTLSSASMDIGVSALAELACPLWLLGYPDQASQRKANALSLALNVGHNFTTGYALFYCALLEALDDRVDEERDQASKLLQIAQSEGFSLFCAAGLVFSGWSSALEGNITGGIDDVRRGLADWTSTGAEIFRPLYLYLLARSYALGGDARNALAALDEAIATVERTNERWIEAELHRLRGQLLLALPDRRAGSPEAEFQHAIQVACGQSAKLFKLRAAASLARFWRDQGRRVEAHELLAPIYNWFTEGFDASDLKDAKALLNELA